MAWNGSGNKRISNPQPVANSSKRSIVWCAVATLTVALIAVLAIFVTRHNIDTTEPEPVQVKGLIKAVEHIELPAYKQVLKQEEELIVLPNGTITNRPKTIAEAVAMVRLKPGMHRFKSVDDVFAKTNDFQIGEYKKPLFKTQIERHLSLIATHAPDRMIPPMPPFHGDMAKDFNSSLNEIISIDETDTEADVETRMKVAEMKKEMRRLVGEEGLTFEQAYAQLEREHNRKANLTQLYKGRYIAMTLSGDPDARAFLEVANQKLSEEGAAGFDEQGHTLKH